MLVPVGEASINLDREPHEGFRAWNNAFGRGSRDFKTTAMASLEGVPIDAISPLKQKLVDLPASLRASAASSPVVPMVISPSCIKVRARKGRIPALHAILLDASESTLAQKKVSIAKRILKSLVEDAYTKRTYASLIVFRGRRRSPWQGL